MNIDEAKELYKNYQKRQKEKDNKLLEEVYEKLKKDINQGKKSFEMKSLYFFFIDDKEVSIEDAFNEEIYSHGYETGMTVKFLYENFTSLGFKVSMKKYGCEGFLLLSGWTEDEIETENDLKDDENVKVFQK